MRRPSRFIILFVTLWLAAGEGTPAGTAMTTEPSRPLEQGRQLYQRACLWCHGAGGQGDGPAGWNIGRFSSPRPRDFTGESFKFRSTPSGDLPSDEDLFRTLTRGIPGVMPSFRALSEDARWSLVEYVKSLNPDFARATRTPMKLSPPPIGPSEHSLANGRQIFRSFGCPACHGSQGQGDGPESVQGHLYDSRRLPIHATDLTARSSLKNGARARDLYRSIMTGLDGTPMPSYADQFVDREADAWDLVWYLLSMSGEQER